MSRGRVSILVLARRAAMSPVSFHGTERRLRMGLVEVPGPEGVYVTDESADLFCAQKQEVREARRASKK